MDNLLDSIKNKIMLGAMGHATTPDFAAKCMISGINVVLPTFVKTPEELLSDISLTRDKLGGYTRGNDKNNLKTALLGVNLMFYGMHYDALLEICIKERVDFITMSAGFDKTIFKKTDIPVFAKVSSLRLAQYSESLGAAGVIVMGSDAGGHIGFPDERNMKTTNELIKEIKPHLKIPVIASGGLTTKEDLSAARDSGADSFQLGTRFLATDECEISLETKKRYITTKQEEVITVPSTTGLPLRVIRTKFAESVLDNTTSLTEKCVGCLRNCSKKYCLQERINKGMKGNIEESLLPASQNTPKMNSIISIEEIASWTG